MNLLDGAQDDQVEVDPNKDYFAELVGDGKKFKTQQDLARSKYEADQYIEILKKRQDQINAEYLAVQKDNMARAKLEELIDRLSKTPNSNTYDPPEVKDDKPGFDPNQIKSLVSQEYLEQEKNRKQADNFRMVQDKLKERYGNNYQNVLKEQLVELGISDAELNDMARKQPKVLIKTLGLDAAPQTEGFQAPPQSRQRTNQFGHTAQERTWSWYQNLKKTDPKAYLSKEIAVQMHNDAQRLGEKFRDGDYYAM
jgi:hypothetical protein